MDRLQAQLKELIVSPQDPRPLSDSVVAAIQGTRGTGRAEGGPGPPAQGASAHLAPASQPDGHLSLPDDN